MSRAGSCEAGRVFGSKDSGKHEPVKQVGNPSCPGVAAKSQRLTEEAQRLIVEARSLAAGPNSIDR